MVFFEILFYPEFAVRKTAAETEQSVFFTVGYEVVTLEYEIGFSNELPALYLQSFQPIEQFLRPVEMETQDIPVLFVVGNELGKTVNI